MSSELAACLVHLVKNSCYFAAVCYLISTVDVTSLVLYISLDVQIDLVSSTANSGRRSRAVAYKMQFSDILSVHSDSSSAWDTV